MNNIPFEISLDDLISEENNEAFVDESGAVIVTPQNEGEQAVSGHMPNPDSDDEVLETAQQMGLHVDENYENPQELNIGADVAAGEKAHRESE